MLQPKSCPGHNIFRFLDHTQLDKHIQFDSTETVISPSQLLRITQHKRQTSMLDVEFKPVIAAIEQPL